MSEIGENEAGVLAIVNEQKQFFLEGDVVKSLRSTELLLGTIALSCVVSPSLYRGFPAKVIDNPKSDTLTVLVDKPTIHDLVDEFAQPNGLDDKSLLKMYVGAGIANLLILHSLVPSRLSKMRKFTAALSEPQQLYARTLHSRVFDDLGADETARRIAVEGHAQTASVNALRLRSGMFIEVQPDSDDLRVKIETTFQQALKELFDGKQSYVKSVGLFDVAEGQAEDMYANTVENMLGLSFPMQKDEITALLKILY